MKMITCFSFARNGYVNYHAPMLSINAANQAVRFKPASDFAYATLEAALAGDTTQPAIPRQWAKVPFVWQGPS